jgi:D-serine deaminase-like pyridoxal phosphate-dependent protein
MNDERNSWCKVENIAEVASPALLVYPDRVEENLKRMIRLTAGGAQRLRPHVKTHKLAELVQMQIAHGITKFKCATIAEAEMTAGSGASDVLLAYQPVGPNVRRLVELVRAFPWTKFSAIADDAGAIRSLSEAFSESDSTIELLLDINCGMNRSGVAPGPGAVELYRLIAGSPALKLGGLHVYDGHLNHKDLAERTALCEAAFVPVKALREELDREGLDVPNVVAGGTPTFPIHARERDRECSPGTCVLSDFGYAEKLPDLDFLWAALVISRVVSKPGPNLLCLDLGHKAIASENPHPRVQFFGLPEATAVGHSEEHLVLETPQADQFAVGHCFYGVPRHICPTVALHGEAVVIKNGRAGDRWKIAARNRTLRI